MRGHKNDMMLQETNNDLEKSKIDNTDKRFYNSKRIEQKSDEDTFDITNDFCRGEVLLDADEDRVAFKIFLRLAKEEKNKEAIDKLLYIALKNNHKPDLLDDDTWKDIEDLPKNEKGYEYAYLLLHFMYYSRAGVEENEKAYKCLKDYFECCEKNGSEISPIAQLQRGICLDFGVGIPADEVDAEAANEYYQKAIDGGCAVAYKYLVCSYIYGAEKLDANQEVAKQYLIEAIKHFKKQFNNKKSYKKAKEIKPFFEELVHCCFLFNNNDKLGAKMINEGKKHAQYMIDNGIKGGYRLMGDYYLYSNEDFNSTMAKNYYEEAIKNNEGAAYGQLALLYSIEGNDEGKFTMAHKGCSANHSFSYSVLGEMFEQRGREEKDKGNDSMAKNCFCSAWFFFEIAFYKFGLSPENLGRLYLEEGILPKTYTMNELVRILEIGAKQLRAESIKCYLRLILRNHGLKDSEITFKKANELPKEYREKYNYYLKIGAYTGDVDLINEYIKSQDSQHIDEKTLKKLYEKLLEKQPYLNDSHIESVYNYADEETKIKVTKYITELLYISGDQIKLVYAHADDTCKAMVARCLLKSPYLFSDQIESIYNYADDKTKVKLTHKLLKDPCSLDKDKMKIIYDYSDDKTKVRLFKKITEGSDLNNDQIEFIYEYADEKTKAKLSKKLINDSYITSNKQLFVEILDNYEGRQDNSFKLWLSKSTTNLFFNENKDELIKLFNRIKEGIEKTEDDALKKMWMSLQSNVNAGVWQVIEELDDESIKDLCTSYRKDDGGIDWETIIKVLSESKDENLKERFDLMRAKIENAYLGIVQTDFAVINELLFAFNNSNDAGLKEIYEKLSNKCMNFINSLFSDTTDE